MARRSYFLVVTLLVMVAVLIGAILLGGGSGESGPMTPNLVDSNGTKAPGEVSPRTADAGGGAIPVQGDPSGVREAVPTGQVPATGDHVALRGRLVRSNGTAVAGAKLIWKPETNGAFGPSPRGANRPTVETGGDGRFVLGPAPNSRGQLEVGAHAGVLFATGDRRSLDVEVAAADKDLGDLIVTDALTLRGQVVDEVGQPLPLARLRVNESFLSLGFGGEDYVVDGEGRFAIVGLEPGTCHLMVSAAGFIPEPRRIEVTRDPPTKEQRFQLKRGASVSGIVYDDVGRPIEGARVNALRRMRVASGVDVEQFDSQASVETSASGAFVIAGIEGDAATLRVSSKGHASETVPNVAVGRSDVIVQLQRFGTVSGVLRDSSGNPLADSTVHARTGGSEVVAASPMMMQLPSDATATTDQKGEFVIEGVRPGPVTLSAEGASHLPLDGVSVQLLAGGKVEHVQLVAEVGAVLDVLVQDEKGKPVAGASVVVAEPDETEDTAGPRPGARRVRMAVRANARDAAGGGPVRIPGDPLRHATTNAEGRALLAGLPAKAVVVRATHEALAPAKPIPVTVPFRGTREVIATLRPGGFVNVRVTDSKGEVVTGARFVLTGPEGEDKKDESGVTAGDGSTRVGPLLAGQYFGRIELPPEPMEFGGMQVLIGDSGTPLDETRRPFDVRSGEEAELVLVRPVLASLTGTVTDASGVVRGAEVRLERVTEAGPMGLGGKTRRTDADGHYSFENVAAGKWRIEWKRQDRPIPSFEEVDVPPGVPSVERDLRIAGGSVSVHVTSAIDHQPLVRADVTLRRSGEDQNGGAPRRMIGLMMVNSGPGGGDNDTQSVRMQGGPTAVRTDDEGHAVLEEVPPGEYELVVEHSKHSDAKIAKIVVVDGSQTDAGSVEMQPAGTIRGKVTGFAADDQIRAAMVVVHKVGAPEGEERRETAMSGAFHIDRLAPGDYELRASPIGPGEGKEGPVRMVSVTAGDTARVELPLTGQ